MFSWNPDAIRFMTDAAEYVGFYDALTEKALPYLPLEGRVCDAGCGLGYISLALSTYCQTIEAVDQDETVLNVLRNNIIKRGVGNISVRCTDMDRLSMDQKYDAMVFSFFGRGETLLRWIKRYCAGNAVLFRKGWEISRFSRTEQRRTSAALRIATEELDAFGVPYKVESFLLDMGQPFRSLEDAVRFYKLYSRENTWDESAEREIKARLQKTNSDKFPYYLPAERMVGMVVINAGDIPDTFLLSDQ